MADSDGDIRAEKVRQNQNEARYVSASLDCVECAAVSLGRAEGWRAFLTDEPDPYVVVFCPGCAAKEFATRP